MPTRGRVCAWYMTKGLVYTRTLPAAPGCGFSGRVGRARDAKTRPRDNTCTPPPPAFLDDPPVFNLARGDEQSVAEAVDLLNEACSTTEGVDEVGEGSETAQQGDEAARNGPLDEEEGDDAGATDSLLARASVLCTSAQGELILGRGTATASDRLGEALKIREKLLPAGHPATVSLVWRCRYYCCPDESHSS